MKVRWLALVHQLPERLRLRSPLLRRDPATCERLADAIAAIAGVHEVRVRPYTGSALVHHARQLDAALLVETARRALDCSLVLAPGEPPPVEAEAPAFSTVARQLVSAIRDLDREILRGTEGAVDLGTLATLGFVGAGAAEVAATGRLPMPPWFNLAWWGFRTFVTMEEDEIRAPDPAPGSSSEPDDG